MLYIAFVRILFILAYIILFTLGQDVLFKTINLGDATSPLQLTYTGDLTELYNTDDKEISTLDNNISNNGYHYIVANFTIVVPPNLAAEEITVYLIYNNDYI